MQTNCEKSSSIWSRCLNPAVKIHSPSRITQTEQRHCFPSPARRLFHRNRLLLTSKLISTLALSVNSQLCTGHRLASESDTFTVSSGFRTSSNSVRFCSPHLSLWLSAGLPPSRTRLLRSCSTRAVGHFTKRAEAASSASFGHFLTFSRQSLSLRHTVQLFCFFFVCLFFLLSDKPQDVELLSSDHREFVSNLFKKRNKKKYLTVCFAVRQRS